jgi:hypothetical protein
LSLIEKIINPDLHPQLLPRDAIADAATVILLVIDGMREARLGKR